MPSMLLSNIIDVIHNKYGDCVATVSVPQDKELSASHITWVSGKEDLLSAEQVEECISIAKQFEYRENRANEYPSIAEQLDTLYHQGYEGWRKQIETIKSKYPKPEGLQ